MFTSFNIVYYIYHSSAFLQPWIKQKQINTGKEWGKKKSSGAAILLFNEPPIVM